MTVSTQAPLRFCWQPNIGMLVFAALFLPVTIALGFWQLERAEEKQALLSEYQGRELANPVVFNTQDSAVDQQYRRVRATGEFINSHTLLLENRIRHGKPGFEVLTPLALGEGQPWLWVNRGWIAGSLDRSQLPKVPDVTGSTTVWGHLYQAIDKPFTVGAETWRPQWPQVLQNFDTALLAAHLKTPFYPYTLRLDQESPAALETGWEVVNLSPATHTGYAVQWFTMALALVVLSVFANSNLAAVLKARRASPQTRSQPDE